MSEADTMMWEARAADGRLDELLGWADTELVPWLQLRPDVTKYELFSAADRLVVIVRFDQGTTPLPDAPTVLLARPAHQWPFRRHGGGPPASSR
jgi:hypothetical protein